MSIYAIRHGETEWNTVRRLQGSTDVPLNENGIRQAEEAAKTIGQYPVDLIICSPLQRTRKTADILNEKLHCQIIYEDALKERGYGDYEGKTPEEYADDPIKTSGRFRSYTENLSCHGVEPMQTLCGRVWGLLDKIKTQYPDKNILLVSHGGTISAINAYFKGICEDGKLPLVRAGNCQIFEYQW